jgi:hypothetical protein
MSSHTEINAAIAAAEADYASLDKYEATPARMKEWWMTTNSGKVVPDAATIRRDFYDARIYAAEKVYRLKKEAGLYANSPGIPTSGGRDQVDPRLINGLIDHAFGGAVAGDGSKPG